MADNDLEPKTQVLVETENYGVWKADDPDGETIYYLGLNNVTVQFFREEWDEFLDLVRELLKSNKS